MDKLNWTILPFLLNGWFNDLWYVSIFCIFFRNFVVYSIDIKLAFFISTETDLKTKMGKIS